MNVGLKQALRRWGGRAILAAACALVGWFYFWTVDPAISQLNTPKPADAYYNLLVEGFRAGHLYLNKQPAPQLAKLANPYDPNQNRPYHVHDLSYYRGHFYMYFGVTPALLLFWPYVALTGHYLFHKHAVAVFAVLGFLVAAFLIASVRRRYFAGVGGGVMLAGVLALGLATGVPPMLRRPDVWEVPIACGYALLMVVLLLIWRALHAPRRAHWWLAGASLAYGLALGARPSLLFGAVVLLVPVASWLRRPAAAAGAAPVRWWSLLAAAVVPITLVGCGLLLYNYLRFNNPFEFGETYQLTWFYEHDLPHFGLKFVWFNLRLYLFQPVWWSCYFPFAMGSVPPPPPPGQLGVENMFGVLTNVPFVWLALAAPLAWWRRPDEARKTLRWFAAAVAALGICALLPLLVFAGACNRYEVDFLPTLILLAVGGVLAVERRLADRPRWRRAARCGWGALLAYSVIFNVCYSLQVWGRLSTEDPSAYHHLAHIGDWPAYAIARLRGAVPGPLELKVKLPPFTHPHYEPLLVTGFAPWADYLYLHYRDARHLTVGFEHTSWGGPVSAPVAVDYGKDHTFVIELGSLYPPPESPWFRGPDDAVCVARLSRVKVLLDGRVAISGFTPVYNASAWNRYPGQNPFAQQFGRKFTGRILAERTLPPPPLPNLRAVGPVTMSVRFGRVQPGLGEPLIVTGVPGRADMLYVLRPDPGHIILGLDHWGGGGPLSKPIAIDPERFYTVQAFMGSLYPPSSHLAPHDPRRRRFEVRFEGRTVLTGDIDFFPATPEQVYFGWNPVGGSTTALRFNDEIRTLHRGE